jgi:signal transduction histidine kinase
MAVRDDTDFYISSDHLGWISATCRSEPALRQLADRILPTAGPEHKTQLVSWSALTDLFFTIEMLLGQKALESAGRDSWSSAPLRDMAQAASLVYQPLDQLLAIYGRAGYLPAVYPVQGDVEQTAINRVAVTLTLQPGAAPCPAFFEFVTGQLRQLTPAMDWPVIDITMRRNATSVLYEIRLPDVDEKLQLRQAASQTQLHRSIAISYLAQQQDLLRRQQTLDELRLEPQTSTAPVVRSGSVSFTDIQAVAARISEAVLLIDHEDLICFANPAAETLFGLTATALNGQPLHKRLLHRGTSSMPATLSDISSRASLCVQRDNDKSVAVSVSISRLPTQDRHLTLVMLRDNTLVSAQADQLANLESSLRAAQRSDAIARLTGGVAHDFSNLLIATLGYVELAAAATTQQEIDQALIEIRRAAERGHQMTRKLLDLSRQQDAQPRPIAINTLLAELQDFLFRLMPSNIECKLESDRTESYIFADRTQIEQVIMNLAINARDAMPAGGQLRISTRVQPAAAALQISVSDTGTGMDTSVLENIFEPFYTTKSAGAGTGLGLAVVREIIEAHNGRLDVESAIGSGTIFSITLPTIRAPARAAGQPFEVRSEGGDENILLIEDDTQVRELARLILLASGYRVVAVADGITGLHRFGAQPQDFDLVLMNALLPGLDAPAVASRMLALNPDVRLACLSSSTDGIPQLAGLEGFRLPVITKPFDRHQLRTAVRTLLDGPRSLDAPDLFG